MTRIRCERSGGLAGALLLAAFLVGCGDSKSKLGSACDTGTVCDGLCMLSLPGGMCTRECDPDSGCSKGTCTKIVGGYYCLPNCDDDSDCRTEDGYRCVVDICRPPADLGEPCARPEDCGSQLICVAGQCGAPCLDSAACLAGYYCVEEGGRSGCAPDDCSSGTCNRPCVEHRDCAAGTYSAAGASDVRGVRDHTRPYRGGIVHHACPQRHRRVCRVC